MKWPLCAALCAALLAPAVRAQSVNEPGPNSVLMLTGNNVSKDGNFYVYYAISTKAILIRPGDTFEYDLYIPAKSTETNGAPDVSFRGQAEALRDLRVTDQNGVRSHPEEIVPQAKDKWDHRVIPMKPAEGLTTETWLLAFEGDKPGPYTIFAASIGIHHKDGSWDWAYHGGPVPTDAKVSINNGYSREIVLRAVDRSWVTPANAEKVIAEQLASFHRDSAISQYGSDVEYVESFVNSAADGEKYKPYIAAAKDVLDKVRSNPTLTADEITAQLHAGRLQLSHAHPLMEAYTGFLVGHSHIDFQWLWEWPESLEVCRGTFNTVCNLMDEFPGFAFSQSSSALYKATQDYYPDVFKRIQDKVKKGTWEIVGGRVCEGDTNMVSPESHARQFLLGQRYFRKNFGKIATVGWEPDTFGHTWSMPEILKMGGIEYYYFCRGGKGKPLFWWEGPDGTKVLTFDEAASGSWYDGNLNGDTLKELFPWEKATGTQSILWVYGVGDHGGGVTREQLNVAKDWMTQPFFPNVKFATATKFFNTLSKGDLSKVPTINDELNNVFQGCYSTHSDMKRLNRDAENATASAETVASIASWFGQPYPSKQFDENWEGIVFNHHHDTLPGSAIHASYIKSREQLSTIVASSKNIANDSLRFLATFMQRQRDMAYDVVVFNPLGWNVTGTAVVPWPLRPDNNQYVAVSPTGEITPVSIARGIRPENPYGDPMATFTATNVGGFGYRVYGIRVARDSDSMIGAVTATKNASSITLENAKIRVTVDAKNGLITSLIDKASNRETVAAGGAANRVEVWNEDTGSQSAWTLGRYLNHQALDGPAQVKLTQTGPGQAVVEIQRDFQSSHITQHIILRAAQAQVETPIWIDWQEWAEGGATPSLKLCSDIAGSGLTASYEIPFATIHRPIDGQEVVALKSADLSGADGGLTLLNDSRHGHSAEGNTLRLTLVRASGNPDASPDQHYHFVNTALLPHAGAYGVAQQRAGFELNQAMLTARIEGDPMRKLPLEKSFVSFAGDTAISTVLKQSEDNPKAMVLRFYEASGKAAHAAITADAPIASTQWVNFIEDPLSASTPGDRVDADLHGYEIRNALIVRK
ncbi:MAG TPA: glycoside hydrolase family 38 C-terminal domain-containing protein [Armatimonadota bacterium]|jgi:alpha-mannosidase